jgi:very-short-patch-repair endonuclease
MKRLTTKEFVTMARSIHRKRYDYSRVNYKNSYTKVIIVCLKHGNFLQGPKSHISGNGCPKCFFSQHKSTTEKFIRQAKKFYGNKYDYSKSVYQGIHRKVIIICPIHGKFLQSPNCHINRGNECPKCFFDKRRHTNNIFINKSRKIHGNKYNYSKVEYLNDYTKVKIICPVHGEFWQKPNGHLNGKGCRECGGRKKLNTQSFICKSKAIHGDKYDYSRVDYKDYKTKVIIVCPEHGKFAIRPQDHYYEKIGCPKCNTRESKGEMLISKILKNHNVDYIQYKKFDGCKNIRQLSYDFYLPKENLLIEFNGQQHYKYINFWNQDKSSLKRQIKNDKIKKDYAIKKGYNFLVLKYNNKNIEETLKKELHYE